MPANNIRNKCIAVTGMFYYQAATRNFSCEMSTLQANGIDVLAQLYHDAADQGFILESGRTGAQVAWVLTGTITDREEEITGWTFAPVESSVTREAKLTGTTMIVWNT